jgi:hypothetical protein
MFNWMPGIGRDEKFHFHWTLRETYIFVRRKD